MDLTLTVSDSDMAVMAALYGDRVQERAQELLTMHVRRARGQLSEAVRQALMRATLPSNMSAEHLRLLLSDGPEGESLRVEFAVTSAGKALLR